MKRIKVNISQEDIDYGVRKSSDHCAISCAIRKQFNTADVFTGLESCLIQDIRYYLSTRARKFVIHFDIDKKLVKPTTFIFTNYDLRD